MDACERGHKGTRGRGWISDIGYSPRTGRGETPSRHPFSRPPSREAALLDLGSEDGLEDIRRSWDNDLVEFGCRRTAQAHALFLARTSPFSH